MSAHSSTDSEEMTVEDENRRNSETDDMHSILDNFMQAKEETLEELVGGFMYLTMDDVVRKASNTARAIASNANNDEVFRGGDADTALTSRMLNRVKAPEHSAVEAENKSGERGGSGEQSEDIEEEVLEDGSGSRQNSEDALFRHRPASLTKFDNFMLCEDNPGSDCEPGGRQDGDEDKEEEEAEEDWLPTSGYMASFAAGNSSPADPQNTQTTTCTNKKQTASQDSSENDTQSQHMSLACATNSEPEAKETIDLDPLCHERTGRFQTASDSAESHCDASSSVCDNDVEAPAWALNPGEAEEEITEAPVEQRVSVIEISTRMVSSSDAAHGEGSAVSQDCEKECNDEVVPFELDEDYDYDNVIYTPKFTQAEMNYLNSFLPQKS